MVRAGWVELEFESAGRVYTVIRDHNGNARLVDVASGATRADTITGVDQEVGVLLGLDREMSCGTFYARQNEIQALDSPEEAKRREQLERLLGIERLRQRRGARGRHRQGAKGHRHRDGGGAARSQRAEGGNRSASRSPPARATPPCRRHGRASTR